MTILTLIAAIATSFMAEIAATKKETTTWRVITCALGALAALTLIMKGEWTIVGVAIIAAIVWIGLGIWAEHIKARRKDQEDA